MTDTDTDTNSDLRLALEEMRLSMAQSISAGDALDQKVHITLAAAGLVMAVIATFQVPLSSQYSDVFWVVRLFAIILFGLAVVLVLFGSRPQTYHLAISPDWNELDKQLIGQPERDAMLSLLSGYVVQVQHNEGINRRKARLHGISLGMLLGAMIILVCLIAFEGGTSMPNDQPTQQPTSNPHQPRTPQPVPPKPHENTRSWPPPPRPNEGTKPRSS